MAIKTDIKNISSQCQVVIFNWKNKIARETLSLVELADSVPLDISKYVLECSFSKTMSDPAGTFQFTLPNDRDWKDVIQRGCWGLIYMSQDGGLSIPKNSDTPNIDALSQQGNKLRGIIFIERVAPKGMVGGERGEFDVEFIVTGRDFGVVYVENEIFYNRLYAEGKIQEAAAGELGVQQNRNTADLLKTLHKAFFSPQELGITLEGDSITKAIPLQWLLPSQLFQALDLKRKRPSDSYFGNIADVLNFSDTLCSYPVENPMTLINGKAWDRLRSYSIEPFHELFPETDDDGKPKLTFRYLPWKTSTGRALGKLNEKVMSMIDVPRVLLKTVDLLEWDIGEDTHSRFNYFFTTLDTSLFTAESTAAVLKDTSPETGFPRIQKNSIRRNGLRLMYTTVNALIQLGSEKADEDLLFLHNELMYEYWNNSVFFESGTMTIIGSNDIKIGKVLELEAGTPYNGGKIFYIESYTDSYTVNEQGTGFWTQSLNLTRGMYPGKIGKRGEDYTDNGEFTEDK
jgi:hypothetical protein